MSDATELHLELDADDVLTSAHDVAGGDDATGVSGAPLAPMGRAVALAALVPILAMIVLGASRFGPIAIDVEPVIVVGAEDPQSGSSPAADERGPLAGYRPDREVELLGDAPPPIEQERAADDLKPALGSFGMPAGIHVPVEPSEAGAPVSASRLYRVARVEMMEVTAYCACRKCCGKNARGLTASGRPVTYNGGRFVAADTRLLPFGTKLRIPHYHEGAVVEVIDRGGAIKGRKLDVYFSDHATARRWGRQILPVEIVEEMPLSGTSR